VNPSEAAAVEFEEPNWNDLFEQECLRWPKLPKYLQQDAAFEEVLRRWRRFHSTPVEIKGEQKRMPAGAVEAMIALAKIKIMPPRSAWQDIPHGDAVEGFQHDDMMWLSIAGEQWRIVAIEDRMMHLSKMSFDGKNETKQIDLNRANWTKYLESAVAVLEAHSAALSTG
jgi:hypothetical protein